jgi:methyl-accepting chemotaxis protein
MPPKENPIQKRQKLDAEISKLNAEYLNASGKEADKLLTKINKLVTQWNKLSDGVKKWNDSIVDAFENLEDVDNELRSIGNMVGKNTAAYEVQRKRIEKSAATLKSIAVIAKDNAKYTDKDRENLIKIGL